MVWVIFMIPTPYIGVFAYLIFQEKGIRTATSSMPSRHVTNLDVRSASASSMRLRNSTGSRNQDRSPLEEYARLRATGQADLNRRDS